MFLKEKQIFFKALELFSKNKQTLSTGSKNVKYQSRANIWLTNKHFSLLLYKRFSNRIL